MRRGKAFAPQFLNSSQKISVRKCFTLFALADKLSLRCGVWAKHYRLMIVVICMDGCGNASPLRKFLVFYVFGDKNVKTAYARWGDMYVES
jgi:hypothetical protein